MPRMARVEEIEIAIRNLTPEEYRKLSVWFHELDQARWDDQIDRDSAAGRLDSLFEEAESDSLQGWPPRK